MANWVARKRCDGGQAGAERGEMGGKESKRGKSGFPRVATKGRRRTKSTRSSCLLRPYLTLGQLRDLGEILKFQTDRV